MEAAQRQLDNENRQLEIDIQKIEQAVLSQQKVADELGKNVNRLTNILGNFLKDPLKIYAVLVKNLIKPNARLGAGTG